jgi:hypothetical protein
MSWIDLANAYGSVKHSLIHFSLEWYHGMSISVSSCGGTMKA